MAIYKVPPYLKEQLRKKLSSQRQDEKAHAGGGKQENGIDPDQPRGPKSYFDVAVELAKRDVKEKNFHFYNMIHQDENLKNLFEQQNLHINNNVDDDEDDGGDGDERNSDEEEDDDANKGAKFEIRKKSIKKLPARSLSPPTRDFNLNSMVPKKPIKVISRVKLRTEIERLTGDINRSVQRVVVLAAVKVLDGNNYDDSLEVMKRKVRVMERSTRISRSLYEVDRLSRKVMMTMAGSNDGDGESNLTSLNQLLPCLRGSHKILVMVVQQMSDMLDPSAFVRSKIYRDVLAVIERVALMLNKLAGREEFIQTVMWSSDLKNILHPTDPSLNANIDLNNNNIVESKEEPTTTAADVNTEKVKQIIQERQRTLETHQQQLQQLILQQKQNEQQPHHLQQKSILKNQTDDSNYSKTSALSQWLRLFMSKETPTLPSTNKENLETNSHQQPKALPSTRKPSQLSMLQRFVKDREHARLRRLQELKRSRSSGSSTKPASILPEASTAAAKMVKRYPHVNSVRSKSSPSKLMTRISNQRNVGVGRSSDNDADDSVVKCPYCGNEFQHKKPKIIFSVGDIEGDVGDDDIVGDNVVGDDVGDSRQINPINKHHLRSKTFKNYNNNVDNCKLHRHNLRCFSCRLNYQQKQQQQQQKRHQQRHQSFHKPAKTATAAKKWFDAEDIVLINDDANQKNDDQDDGADFRKLKEKLNQIEIERQAIKDKWSVNTTSATVTTNERHSTTSTTFTAAAPTNTVAATFTTTTTLTTTTATTCKKSKTETEKKQQENPINQNLEIPSIKNSKSTNDIERMNEILNHWDEVDGDFFKYVDFTDVSADDKLKMNDLTNLTASNNEDFSKIASANYHATENDNVLSFKLSKLDIADDSTVKLTHNTLQAASKTDTKTQVDNKRYQINYRKPIYLSLDEASYRNIMKSKKISDRRAKNKKIKLKMATRDADGDDNDPGDKMAEEDVDFDTLSEYLSDKLVNVCLRDVCDEMERVNNQVVEKVFQSEFNS